MTYRRWLAVASRCGAFAALSAAAVLSSCRKTREQAGNAAADADTRTGLAAGSASFTPASVDAGGFVVATRRSCRVMALHGTKPATSRPAAPSTQDGEGERGGVDAQALRSLARGDLVPEGELIELPAGTELTVQATVSTREITLVGPATAEACPGGEEAVRLARGRVSAFPGAGVRPGAEVWIATPLGVVRFSDAKIEIAVPGVDADRLEVAVITGRATFVPAAGVAAAAASAPRVDAASRVAPAAGGDDGSAESANAGGALALAAGVTFQASRPAVSVARWVRDLVGACVRQAGVARKAAELVVSPQDAARASRGDLAFAHVRARQHARAACEAAWTAGALAPGLLDATLRADLEAAGATWKGTPVTSPPASSGAPSRAAGDAE